MDEQFVVTTKQDCEEIAAVAQRNPVTAAQFKPLILDAVTALHDALDAINNAERRVV